MRGIIALGVLLFWQYATSYVAMRWPRWPGFLLTSPSLIIAYRGRALERVMHKHRVSRQDLDGALRGAGVWNICEVEVVAIEPNGQFSVFKRADYPRHYVSASSPRTPPAPRRAAPRLARRGQGGPGPPPPCLALFTPASVLLSDKRLPLRRMQARPCRGLPAVPGAASQRHTGTSADARGVVPPQEPDVLYALDGYRALRELEDSKASDGHGSGSGSGGGADDEDDGRAQNDVAAEAC